MYKMSDPWQRFGITAIPIATLHFSPAPQSSRAGIGQAPKSTAQTRATWSFPRNDHVGIEPGRIAQRVFRMDPRRSREIKKGHRAAPPASPSANVPMRMISTDIGDIDRAGSDRITACGRVCESLAAHSLQYSYYFSMYNGVPKSAIDGYGKKRSFFG